MDARLSSFVVLAVVLAGCAVTQPARIPSTTPFSTSTSAAPTAVGPTSPTPTAPASGPTPSRSPAVPPRTACAKPASGFLRVAPGKGKTVALTFDDGPGPADEAILGILDRFGIHATFFETGAQAAASPATVALLAAHGELVADHTWSHRYPSQLPGGWTPAYLHTQLVRTNTELVGLTGRPVCFMRPPGGFTQNVLSAAQRLNMSAVLWSVDSLDWRQPPLTTAPATAAIVANATAAGGRGHPIVLMHSGKASHEPENRVSSYRGNTIAALPAVIRWYHSHGYRFVTMAGSS